jgi:hypothetical protein
MLLGGPQNTIKSHLVFTALFCFAPFSVFFSRMSAPYSAEKRHHDMFARVGAIYTYDFAYDSVYNLLPIMFKSYIADGFLLKMGLQVVPIGVRRRVESLSDRLHSNCASSRTRNRTRVDGPKLKKGAED